jgi:regulator of sigma E protease
MSTLLAFVLTLAVLIVVHEYGHYRVAKFCGVKVLRFSVGFGRVIWRRQSGPDATEFTLSALPLGGYVRMLDEREGPVDPAERERAFNNRPLRQRVAIVVAGPLANLLLAVLLFATVNWTGQEQPQALLGTPPAGSLAERAGLRAGEQVLATSADGQQWQELQSLPELYAEAMTAMADGRKLYLEVGGAAAGHGRRRLVLDTDSLGLREFDTKLQRQLGLLQFGEPVLLHVAPGGAGAQAGLQSGDRVLSIDGVAVADGAGVRSLIRAAVDGGEGRVMQWRVERAARVVELEVQPKVVDDTDEPGRKIGRIEVGIGSAPALVTVQYGFVDGLARGAERTWDTSWLTLKLFGRMLIGEASLKHLSGPLTIADYAGQSARQGLPSFLGFLALVSVSLGVLNLLPLPMLDGGHLMYYLFEGLSGRPVSEWWQRQLQRAGALILMLMMFLALSNDVARLTGLH